MTELKLEISPADIQTALQQALVQALTPEKCEALVKEAIGKLLQGSWQSPSELQRIFSMAAERVARDCAEAEMKKPENIERIQAMVSASWERVFAGELREKMLSKVSGAIAAAICGQGY